MLHDFIFIYRSFSSETRLRMNEAKEAPHLLWPCPYTMNKITAKKPNHLAIGAMELFIVASKLIPEVDFDSKWGSANSEDNRI